MEQDRISQDDAQRRDSHRRVDGTWGPWASGESGVELTAVDVRPVTDESFRTPAVELSEQQAAEWADEGHRFDTGGEGVTARQSTGEITFENEHGQFAADRGDWVVANDRGECFVVDDETFQRDYQHAGDEGADLETMTGTVTDGMATPEAAPFANTLLTERLGEDVHPDQTSSRSKEIFDETGIDPDDPRFKMASEAKGKSRDAHIRAIRQGRTRWLRRAQMLTALGTGKRQRILQSWSDMRRDSRVRKNLISEEQYWQSIAGDMHRQAEMLESAEREEQAQGKLGEAATPKSGMPPAPQEADSDHAGETAELPEVDAEQSLSTPASESSAPEPDTEAPQPRREQA